MSKLKAILDEIAAAEASLALKIAGKDLPVVVRKLPSKGETVDPAYQTTVSGAERVDQSKRIAFGSRWQILYNVDITLITPSDGDTLLNLLDHTDWREATRGYFMRAKPLATEGVKRVEIIDAAFLDRSQLAQGYDYNQVSLQITTYEDRS